jgi:transcriptional regulator with XRE-family HTH domain
MAPERTHEYKTITGRGLSLAQLTPPERDFLKTVGDKYKSRPEWTRFAAWWNAEFNRAGLSTTSVTYRVCQDLEARLGIAQGRLSPPDYRDFLADLIDAQFGSRQEFCKRSGVDPGQLSRVFSGRADLSIRALQKVLEGLGAHLVVQTEEEVRAHTSMVLADEALAVAGRWAT